MNRRRRSDATPNYAARHTFEKVRRAEESYARGLRGIARHIGSMTMGFQPGIPDQMGVLETMLRRYSVVIEPWAVNHATRMLVDVARRDAKVWNALAAQLSVSLRQEIRDAPTGRLMQALLGEQVGLITSLPTEAAERIHKLTIEGLLNSTRASEIAREIARTGEVSTGRANLIARTEVARTASTLVQARSEFVGSTHYIWRTSRDSTVRKQHRALEGKVIAWSDPPAAGPNGERYHAGQGPNCRCFNEPILPN